jgi:hypothetical protein
LFCLAAPVAFLIQAAKSASFINFKVKTKAMVVKRRRKPSVVRNILSNRRSLNNQRRPRSSIPIVALLIVAVAPGTNVYIKNEKYIGQSK